jgi:hypothetical protein
MYKKIEFILDPNFTLPINTPIPAASILPNWWKQGESFINKETGALDIDSPELKVAGMKSCMPFLDALNSGYFLTTWADVEVTVNDGEKIEYKYLDKNSKQENIYSRTDWKMIKEREGAIGYTIPRPAGHADNHMVWESKWGWKVPKGWSVLVTHPLNQAQLPFTTLSAIVDSDRFAPHGNIPFFFKEGWTGVIEKGTPFAQLIPINRQEWVATSKVAGSKDVYTSRKAREVQFGYYRSKIWVPKKYTWGKNVSE